MTEKKKSASMRVGVDLPAKGRLPAARFDLTILDRKPPSVLAAYLEILGREGHIAGSRSFDDGRIVADLDDHGAICGIEFLALSAPGEVPEFLSFARAGDDPIPETAVALAMTAWLEVQLSFRLGPARAARKTAGEVLVGHVPPWRRSRFDDESLAHGVLELARSG